MGLTRNAAVKAREMDPKYYRTYSGGGEPERLRVLTRHSANLLETPLLFYVVVLMIHVTDSTSSLFVGLAWAYVVLRFVHAFIHLGTNFVLHRFLSFGLGLVVLLAMWVLLLVRLVVA